MPRTAELCAVVPYPPGRTELGGGGWVDRRWLTALDRVGTDVTIFSVTGPEGRWTERGWSGMSAGSVPLEVRYDRRVLARIVARMVTGASPYLEAKFTTSPGWGRAAAALGDVAAGRRVVTSGWPALLLAGAADVDVDVHLAHNVDTVIAAAHAPRPLRILGEAPRLARRERRLLERPRRVLTLSRLDAERLTRWGVSASAVELPLTPQAAADDAPRRVGFLGKATWPPNAGALDVLLGPVHERLTDLGIAVEFVLGGAGTERFADHPRVVASGPVDDLGEFYRLIGLVVVPRLGPSTGISVKVLEAAEWGIASVIPNELANAIDPSGPWLVADDAGATAAAIAEWFEGGTAPALREWVDGRSGDDAARRLVAALAGASPASA